MMGTSIYSHSTVTDLDLVWSRLPAGKDRRLRGLDRNQLGRRKYVGEGETEAGEGRADQQGGSRHEPLSPCTHPK